MIRLRYPSTVAYNTLHSLFGTVIHLVAMHSVNTRPKTDAINMQLV